MQLPPLGRSLDRRVRLLAPARRLRFQLVAEVLERFANGASLHVLDAGCGEGLFATSIAQRQPSWTIVGVDHDRDLVERARLAARDARVTNVELVHADLTGDLGRDRYDAVVAIECLEEIAEDTRALQQMIAAVRLDGLFVAHVPEQRWQPVLRGSDATWRHEVRHGYEASELAQRLTALGLEEVEVRGTSRSLVRLAQELRDSVKNRNLVARTALVPLLVTAVSLERHGVTWGRERALLASGRRGLTQRAPMTSS